MKIETLNELSDTIDIYWSKKKNLKLPNVADKDGTEDLRKVRSFNEEPFAPLNEHVFHTEPVQEVHLRFKFKHVCHDKSKQHSQWIAAQRKIAPALVTSTMRTDDSLNEKE